MISFRGKTILITAILTFAGFSFGQSVGAPVIDEVKFVKGVFESNGVVQPHGPCASTVPQGVCGNADSRSYTLEGRKGDWIWIRVTSRTGGAVFSAFGPERELLQGGSATKRLTLKLPADGRYWITVFTNASYTPFKIRISGPQEAGMPARRRSATMGR